MLKLKLPGGKTDQVLIQVQGNGKAVEGLTESGQRGLGRIAGASQQARVSLAQQAGGLADTAQSAIAAAKEQAVFKAADVAQAMAKLTADAVPAVVGLAGQTRDVASQVSGQARGRVAPQAEALAQNLAKQRDVVAPLLADWAGQTRGRLEDLGQQAREEFVPAVAGRVGQTRERVVLLGGQAKEQLMPTAADLAEQARSQTAKLSGQTRDTAASLQAAAGAVAPAVAGAASGTVEAFGGALDVTGRAVRRTLMNVVWITVLGGIALFLYAPEDEERAKLLGAAREWLSYATDLVMELRGGE